MYEICNQELFSLGEQCMFSCSSGSGEEPAADHDHHAGGDPE